MILCYTLVSKVRLVYCFTLVWLSVCAKSYISFGRFRRFLLKNSIVLVALDEVEMMCSRHDRSLPMYDYAVGTMFLLDSASLNMDGGTFLRV